MHLLPGETAIETLKKSSLQITNLRVIQTGQSYSSMFLKDISLIKFEHAAKAHFISYCIVSAVLAVIAIELYLYAAIALGFLSLYFLSVYVNSRKTVLKIYSTGSGVISAEIRGVKKREVLKFAESINELKIKL